ncbi:MAG TPA: pyridoxamine 5'-phosphate oxidase family protein [Chloroflexota bacterium]|nr:pyridoxamine 5'-phosphate oxidase family protein [Chloroflexota bacterium]
MAALLDQAIVKFLKSHRIAHLATADGQGTPHVLPICFAIVDQLIYTPLDRKPKRGADPRSLEAWCRMRPAEGR